jgi:ribosome recycling factor
MGYFFLSAPPIRRVLTLTHKYTKRVDELAVAKEADLMKV